MSERRKDYELRQIIEEYRRMAAKAEESAAGATSAELRAGYLAAAASWTSLAEELTGRALSAADGETQAPVAASGGA